MGFSHPFAFPAEVHSNGFCKARFACKPALHAALLLQLFQHTENLQTFRCSPAHCLWQAAATSAPAQHTYLWGEMSQLGVGQLERKPWRGTGGCEEGYKPGCHTSVPCQGQGCTQLSRPAGVASLADHDISALYRLHFTTAWKEQRVGLERTEKQYAIFYLYWKKAWEDWRGGSSLPNNTVS